MSGRTGCHGNITQWRHFDCGYLLPRPCLSVGACLRVFRLQSPSISFARRKGSLDNLIRIPDPINLEVYTRPHPRNSFENGDTLASPSSPIKCEKNAGGARQIKKIKALPCLFIGLFVGVSILERLSWLLIRTGYSINGLHVEFSLVWQQLPALLIFCYRWECPWSFFNWGASKPSDWSTAAS